MTRRLEESFVHGTRVRVGTERGVLLHCERRTGEGKYWRIQLQNGTWVWPDSFAVDGDGDEWVRSCGRCELPFYRKRGSGELLCSRCDIEQFGRREDRARDSVSFGERQGHDDTYRRRRR